MSRPETRRQAVCACAALPGKGARPDALVTSGEMIREARRVHRDPQCTEDVLVCAQCGTRYWVIGDDGHWSGTQYHWHRTRPLDLI